ncbi:MAG: membrane protein insertase YidC [Thermonemataceae bacterium]|nr:membrane protein insertase YidC [Thermonemataceae bacterium]
MDRNQAIGMVLISAMIFVYFFFFASPPSDTKEKEPKKIEISKNKENKQQQIPTDSKAYEPEFLSGKSQDFVLENENLKITFNTKGGKIKQVLLKGYQTYDKKPLLLLDESFSQMSYILPTKQGKIDLYGIFYEGTLKANTLILKAKANGKEVEQSYTLLPNSFELDYKIKVNGFELSKEEATLLWNADMPRTEKDATPSRIKSTIAYYAQEDGYDYLSESGEKQEETIAEPLQWVAFRQQFFIASIFATEKNTFTKAALKTTANEKDQDVVKSYEAKLSTNSDNLQKGQSTFKFYLGPNKYDILKKFDNDFSRNVGLGWGIFGWVNKFLVIPILDVLKNLGSYGLIIIVLVIILRLILFPLSYKSYLGMAKMKVLKPEIDEIKVRTGGDMQKMQQEQMELFRQVGINPLASMVPMLLQMPILIAMFQYFPNAIELRQESLFWADDLSTYDSILNLPFNIPFYGSHVSLFTILMTASTIVYTWFSNQNSTAEASMKVVGYVMPLVFMFMLNSYPAGLSYYYFISNISSILQQIGIKRFVNEEKIKAILEKNKVKNKDKKKSGFQQRLEEALKAQQEKLETKQKELQKKQQNNNKNLKK